MNRRRCREKSIQYIERDVYFLVIKDIYTLMDKNICSLEWRRTASYFDPMNERFIYFLVFIRVNLFLSQDKKKDVRLVVVFFCLFLLFSLFFSFCKINNLSQYFVFSCLFFFYLNDIDNSLPGRDK